MARKKNKSIASKEPLLYAYAGLFLLALTVSYIAYIRQWHLHTKPYEALDLSPFISNCLVALELVLISVIFLAPLLYLLVAKNVRKVTVILKVYQFIFAAGFLLVLLRGASVYGLAIAGIQLGFTVYILRLVQHT
jgi:hypothetical protein